MYVYEYVYVCVRACTYVCLGERDEGREREEMPVRMLESRLLYLSVLFMGVMGTPQCLGLSLGVAKTYRSNQEHLWFGGRGDVAKTSFVVR